MDIVLTSVGVTIGQTRALDDVSLTITRGESIALTGSNGSGKSTLLAVIARILAPTDGRMSRHTGPVAWVAQRSQVPDGLPVTVRDVVTMGRWRGWKPLTRTDRAIVDESLAGLGLDSLASRSLTELSGGQRQRVFVAQALARRAELLLLDEPTVGLDDVARALIHAALDAELARGTTIVHATHDLGVAARSHRVVQLTGGKMSRI